MSKPDKHVLNDLDAAVLSRVKDDDDHSIDDLHDLLIRRFSDCSGVHLFIAANNIGVDLPPDLDGASHDDDLSEAD